MPDPQNSGLGPSLLREDTALASPRYEEHRMELERQLSRAESREVLVHRVAVGALLTAIASGALTATQVFGSADFGDRTATPLSVAMVVLYVASLSVFALGFAAYYGRFRPAVRQTRERLILESIRELRGEVRELRQKVEGRQP